MHEKRGLVIVLVLSILLMLSFSYLIVLHYSETESFCDVSKGISCDIVNRSLYSEIFGIPVAALGLLTFFIMHELAFAALILHAQGDTKKMHNRFSTLLHWMLFIVIMSIFFSIYLIYIELFVLYSICIMCVVSDVLILIIFFILLRMHTKILGKKLYKTVTAIFWVSLFIVAYIVYSLLSQLLQL